MIWYYIISAISLGITLMLWRSATFYYEYLIPPVEKEGSKLPMPLWLLILLLIIFLVPMVNIIISLFSLVIMLIIIFTGGGGKYDTVSFPDKGIFKVFNALNKNLNA